MLFDITPEHRIGAQYRSPPEYDVGGRVSFANPALPPALAAVVGALASGVNTQLLYNSALSSKIKLPEIIDLSYFGRLNERWDLMADVQYTGWISIETLTFTGGNGSPLQTTTENFRNAWRYALGANHRCDAQWLLRGGVAYDQSPVQDGYRSVRLPDSDRTWLTLGARCTPDPKWWVEVGAAYIWVKSGSIDEIGSSNFGLPPSAAQSGRVSGSCDNNVVVLSVQLSYAFRRAPGRSRHHRCGRPVQRAAAAAGPASLGGPAEAAQRTYSRGLGDGSDGTAMSNGPRCCAARAGCRRASTDIRRKQCLPCTWSCSPAARSSRSARSPRR